MFSLSMPLTSFRPIPPIPMQATLSLSLGGMNPRPSTCRGTMVNAVSGGGLFNELAAGDGIGH